MTTSNDCKFCNADGKADKEKLKNELPGSIPCKTDIYDDNEYCFAILCPEQYTIGHTLLLLEKHRTDITDNIPLEELVGFITAIHKVAKHLKAVAENQQGNHPERIYVGILCDGIEHLHAHLIPRYPFSKDDKQTYIDLFSERDDEEKARNVAENGDIGGFWYVSEREKNWGKTQFGQKQGKEKVKYLQDLAEKLRMSKTE